MECATEITLAWIEIAIQEKGYKTARNCLVRELRRECLTSEQINECVRLFDEEAGCVR